MGKASSNIKDFDTGKAYEALASEREENIGTPNIFSLAKIEFPLLSFIEARIKFTGTNPLGIYLGS